MTSHIKQLERQFDRALARCRDESVIRWAIDGRREMREQLDYLRRENGYEHYVLDRIHEERQKSMDERQICTCGNSDCELKQGSIPRDLRRADDFETGVRRFKQNHYGKPIVLENCRDEWAEMIHVVENRYLLLISGLNQGRKLDLPEL